MNRGLLVALVLASVGCGGDEEPTVLPPRTLEIAIGDQGRTVLGRPYLPWEGLRIEIPPGALPSGTTFFIGLTHRPGALPEDGFEVGPTIVIDPPLPLARPARVTLPVHTDRLARLGADGSDLLVWASASGTWVPVDPLTHDAVSVTVEVSTLSSMAAGVRVDRPPVEPTCLPDCLSHTDPTPMSAVVGDPRLAWRGTEVAWLVAEASDLGTRIRAARLDVASGAQATTSTLDVLGGSAAVLDRGIALAAGGDVWIAVDAGLALLPAVGDAVLLDLPEGDTLAHAITSAADAPLWLILKEDALTVRFADGSQGFATSVDTNHAPTTPTLTTRLVAQGELFAVGDTVSRLDLDAQNARTLATLPGRVVAVADAVDRALVIAEPDMSVSWVDDSGAVLPIASLGRGSAAASLVDGSVWVALSDYPAVARVGLQDDPTVFLTRDVTPDSLEGRNAIVTAIAPVNTSVLAVSRSGALTRIRP